MIRQHAHHPRQCTLDCSDQTRSGKVGCGESIPRGFVPSIQRIPNPGSAAARKTGRYSATRALLRAEVRAPYEQTHRKHPSRTYGCHAQLSLARQRPTVGELYRAFGHLDRGLQLASPTFRVVTGSKTEQLGELNSQGSEKNLARPATPRAVPHAKVFI